MLPDRISQAIPQGQGFIRSYCEYAATCSDAPEIFHVGVALTVLSAAVARRLTCPYSSGSPLVPNLYTLLVGPSRSGRKSSCMDTGVKILRAVHGDSVIPVPGSYEELIAQLRSTPAGVLSMREFGHFLKTTQRGYGEPIRTVLMDLFDHPVDQPYTRNLRKGKTVIEGPVCLCLLSACSDELLFSYTTSDEWMGGFFGRMLMLYGDRDGFRLPNTWPQAQDYLTAMLHQYMYGNLHRCAGFSPPAWQEFERWAQYRDSTTKEAPTRVQSFISGSQTLAAKISLLYAADAAEPNAGDGWLVSHEAMRRAIMFVEQLYLPSIFHLGETLALGIWERDRQKVLRAIDSKPNGIERPELLRRAKVSSDYLESILTTLKDERTIVQGMNAKEPTYRRVKLGDPGGGGGGASGDNVIPIKRGG
jgi:hypothetical protein